MVNLHLYNFDENDGEVDNGDKSFGTYSSSITGTTIECAAFDSCRVSFVAKCELNVKVRQDSKAAG